MIVKHYTIGEAKAKFSAVIKEALAGEEVIVARGRNRKPLVKIVPAQADDDTPRRPGAAKHWKMWIAEDAFDTPVPGFERYWERKR
jgi:antitoxin (DNA-binding transcriptional repressor) of toxin-antitoxin stability system